MISLKLLLPLLLSMILLGMPLSGGVNFSADYFRSDPIGFHENLRRRAMEGVDNREILEMLHTEFNEHSFDGLRQSSPPGNAGFMLLYGAWTLWGDGGYDQAGDYYRRAGELFSRAGMESEAGFCGYYRAALESEQENFLSSLRLLNRVLEKDVSGEMPYLRGLINESLGYDLWYLDRLPESAESFGKAADTWERIGYRIGMVNCWSNLGLLYQELELPVQAWRAYEKAVEYLDGNTFPETKFLLYRNCALYHFRNNKPDMARKYLLLCREYRHCGPSLYTLARAEILEQPELLEKIETESPSIGFVRDMLRARFRRKAGDHPGAARLVREVIAASREADMPRYTREARLLLGEILEEQGLADEAGEIFRGALDESGFRTRVDILLPFSRSDERKLDGLVRCLLRQGKTDRARSIIQEAVALKTWKGTRLLDNLRTAEEPDSRVLAIGVQDVGETDVVSHRETFPKHSSAPDGYSVVEFWPDGREMYVWIDNPGDGHFVRLELEDWIQDTVPALTAGLYSGSPLLPPWPSRQVLSELYRQLFQPLENRLEERRVLIIAHKELQSLPFEMLRTPRGKYLLEKYTFSYLPGRHYLGQFREIDGSPVLIQPEGFSRRSGARAELAAFESINPGLEVRDSLRIRDSISAPWIHIGSHLRLDRRFWLDSSLAGGESSISMAELLKHKLNCSLLSMGVCESANSDLSASPYWMGFSEILMLNGAETLLTSRWRMDELSSGIYTEFFKLCRGGIPMDEALRQARLKFLQPGRNGLPAHASHPFYWAGITYVGEPGLRLPGSMPRESKAGFVPVILWLILLGAVVLRDIGSAK